MNDVRPARLREEPLGALLIIGLFVAVLGFAISVNPLALIGLITTFTATVPLVRKRRATVDREDGDPGAASR